MSLFSALTTAILPVLSIAVVGYLLGSLRDVDVDPLGTVTMYILAPALVFHSLATTELAGRQVAGVAAGVAVFTIAMLAISDVTGRLLGETEPIRSGFVLASTFPNSGNMGIPLSAFAFGFVGRSTAVLFLTVQSILVYTLGLYVASRGQGSLRESLGEVFRVPLIYAVVAAGAARWFGVVPPTESTAMQTIGLVGDAAIPLLLIVLGVQLANTEAGAPLRRVAPVNVLKLGVAPAVGLAIVPIVGLTDPTVVRTFVLECAMPAAITPLIFAIEFDVPGASDLTRPAYLSTAILTTTLASVPTLTVLIVLLESGLVG